MKAGEAWLILLNLLWILEGTRTTANSLAFSLFLFFALSFGSLSNFFFTIQAHFYGSLFYYLGIFIFLLR